MITLTALLEVAELTELVLVEGALNLAISGPAALSLERRL